MENKIFKSTILEKEVIIQLLKMENSIYLNIGENEELNLKSILFSIPTKFDPIPNLQNIKISEETKPDWHEHSIEMFIKSLSKKINMPVYASIDLNFKEELDAMAILGKVKEIVIKNMVETV